MVMTTGGDDNDMADFIADLNSEYSAVEMANAI